MDALQRKISIKFKLSEAEVQALFAAGFDTPAKIKAATAEQLPADLRGKLTRWQAKKRGSGKKGQGQIGQRR